MTTRVLNVLEVLLMVALLGFMCVGIYQGMSQMKPGITSDYAG